MTMLLVDETKKVFNLGEVHRGTILYAKREGWDEGVTGTVVAACPGCIRVQYLPAAQNVQNQCVIDVGEVEAGLWQVRYSNDGLETVQGYGQQGGDDEP
jgi:hypothetical protein